MIQLHCGRDHLRTMLLRCGGVLPGLVMSTGTGLPFHVQQLVVSLSAFGPGTQAIQLVPEGTGPDRDAVTRREGSLTEAEESHQIPSLFGRH
jgi:hypothetical protein